MLVVDEDGDDAAMEDRFAQATEDDHANRKDSVVVVVDINVPKAEAADHLRGPIKSDTVQKTRY